MPPRDQRLSKAAAAVPPQAWFGVSAIFHYLGPSFAVLLFPAIGVLGVAWLRIASAALVFVTLTHPLRTFRQSDARQRLLLAGLGLCLAGMNTSFYLALERLPMSLVAAMEFVGVIAVAACGLASLRNVAALACALIGVFLLIEVKWAADPVGIAWATLNSLLFVVYILLGHRAARAGASDGVAILAAAMLIAMVVLLPVGFEQARDAMRQPVLVLAAFGVGVCSSVIPYVCDQLAMSRLRRETFALMLSLLPACATVIAAIVLAQVPALRDVAGIGLVMTGIAMHRPRQVPPGPAAAEECGH